MSSIVDTSIRLLTQEPLAGRISTTRLLELAELLDSAGFGALEISGGGCFACFVERGVESPWEFIRSVRSRCQSPLAMALRGRFLVGTQLASPDITKRFVATAAESGIDIFRLHDPLNDLENLQEAADAIHEFGKQLNVGLIYNPGGGDEGSRLIELAKRLPELGAHGVVIDDPAGCLDGSEAGQLVKSIESVTGLEVGVSAHGAGGRALAAAIEVARAGGSSIGTALYPIALALHRPSVEMLVGSVNDDEAFEGINTDLLWDAVLLIGDSLDDSESTSLTPSIAARAAQRQIPVWLVEEIAGSLHAQGVPGRLNEVLDELEIVGKLIGAPPLVAPIGQILGSQALVNVLSAQRWSVLVDDFPDLVLGSLGSLPNAVDPVVLRAIELRGGEEPSIGMTGFDDVRVQAEGIASSDEDLLLLALFGESVFPLLESIRNRGSSLVQFEESNLERDSAERIRDLIEIIENADIGELTVEEGDLKVTVRKAFSEDTPTVRKDGPSNVSSGSEVDPLSTISTFDAPMVGTFYRASEPGAPPFVEEGQIIEEGQTLCILEAMKVMNEVKANSSAVVRKVCVADAQPVEYGQVLFELEPLSKLPLDAVT